MLKTLIEAVRIAFEAPVDHSPVSLEESRRQSDRRIVRRLATGDMHLKLGQYVTREDLDREYERVKTYRFDDV